MAYPPLLNMQLTVCVRVADAKLANDGTDGDRFSLGWQATSSCAKTDLLYRRREVSAAYPEPLRIVLSDGYYYHGR